MVSKRVTNFCKGIIVTLTLNLLLTLQTWHSLHVDKKCSWLGPSGGGSGYIVHVRGGDCFVPFHSSYWGKHFARLFVMPSFFVRLLSANTSFKRLPLDLARWNAYFQKISISPEGTFVSKTQPSVLVMAHHPWNFHDFPTWLGIPWKEYFCQKSWCTILLCHLLPLVYCRLLDPSPLRISFVLRWRVCIFSGTTQSWGLQVNRMLPQYYEGFALAIIHSKRWGL